MDTKNQIIRILGVLVVLILISGFNGCVEELIGPVCGNGIIEEGETSENCCMDVGCPEGKDCEDNVCVELETPITPVCGNGIMEEGETSENCCLDVGCPEGFNCVDNSCTPIDKEIGGKEKSTVGNPAAVYCGKLGYEYKISKSNCIFPDGSECGGWDFYRGKCGQEWGYCTQEGYDMKNLTQNEGWINGGICTDKNTSEEIGNIYDLMKLGGERENESEIIIDPLIIEKFNTQDEVCVAVILKDNLNLSCHGTIEECRPIYEIKKQHYLKLEDEVLSTLLEEDFRLIQKGTLSPDFSGYITKSGLEKLKSNPDVIEIQADKEVWLQ